MQREGVNMLKFITGAKGSGKTKWLIDNANSDYKSGNGNIAFVDVDDNHIFSLDYNVRLINASEYQIESLQSFYGFLCGLQAMDYDLEKIYVDGIYKIIELDDEKLQLLFEELNEVSDKSKTDIYINVNRTIDKMPEALQAHSEEAAL